MKHDKVAAVNLQHMRVREGTEKEQHVMASLGQVCCSFPWYWLYIRLHTHTTEEYHVYHDPQQQTFVPTDYYEIC